MTSPVEIVLRDVEIDGIERADCRVRDGVIAEISSTITPLPGQFVIDGRGGSLIPGLADHHLHLGATAAALTSVDLTFLDASAVPPALEAAPRDEHGWVRAVGYDEVRHGRLDRSILDGWTGTPVRVQHRSGALWVLNSAGLESIGAEEAHHDGIERDPSGRLTGLLWRADEWLRSVVRASPPPLRSLGAALARFGITHVTDATPGMAHVPLVMEAVRNGDIPQHVMLMSASAVEAEPRITSGPVKIVAADHSLPSIDELVACVVGARQQGRAVAVHCVTEAALAITLAALDQVGVLDGDRVEHAAVAPPALVAEVAARGLRVVTQPSLVSRRGDDYLARAEVHERSALWPYASLLRAGIPTAPSSDAPYGDLDPWAGLQAASSRRTRTGLLLGADERVDAAIALRGMWTALDDPGGRVRAVEPGSPADLVLLDRPLADALSEPSARCVRATMIRGELVYGA